MCSTLISHCDGYIIANKPICPETCVFTISQDNHDYYSSNTYRDLSGAHYYVEPSEIDESLIDPILSDGRFLAAVIACYKSTRPLMMICSFVLGLDSSAPHEQNAFTQLLQSLLLYLSCELNLVRIIFYAYKGVVQVTLCSSITMLSLMVRVWYQ